MKRLIVNADDLGRTRGINEGILQAHREGVVTSATLMVNYPAAREVRDLLRKAPDLGVGLHVALTGGPLALPADRIPSLYGARGRAADKPDGLAGASVTEVLAEARVQLDRFRELLGREPTHIDSHHHSHRLPVVFEALTTIARESKLPIRNAGHGTGDMLREARLRAPDYFVESFFGEEATLDHLLDIIDSLPDGTTELMCHPAVADEELRRSSSYAEPRTRELEVLTDPTVRTALHRRNVQLVNFGAL